ncbi:hypothetical protein [Roseateles sp. BYS96W]|uniref:Uncharacterized protein n=1 Tax=Pelomonas nitida TaxID=3299027 RepID=A0ABW7G0J5_9BURK
MTRAASGSAQLLTHWQRQSLAVRLAYDTARPCAIGCYLALGRKLIDRGLVSAVDGEERMYRLLMQTATDVMLPEPWREFCLRAALHPLARLAPLLEAAGDVERAGALYARWDLAWRQLQADA